mmetsp:Transcript_3658/g.8594  ORF Transcript_3658/g.8594 Transcript_3658/m.8594 type:complete len:213 (+) Transcript_3658:805-1443(+)
MPQSREHTVGSLEVLQVEVCLRLGRVKHLENMRDLLHKHRNGVPGLLGAIEELVDLKSLHELRVGLDEDRLCPPCLIKHVLPLDVIKLSLHARPVRLQVSELVVDVGALLGQLRIDRHSLAALLLETAKLVPQSALILLIAVDARRQVIVLSLKGVSLLLEILKSLLDLVLRLQGQLEGVLEHAVLLLQEGLHLSSVPRFRLRCEFCIDFDL